ncbi:hypothetical protein ABIA35_008379 [Catenulispora sp. MAP12-49]|uniref:hypothetical protein n=1 Tax=Catenulispora sp. MAP12-49 TaxID=3156302 RepID=UPI0035183465
MNDQMPTTPTTPTTPATPTAPTAPTTYAYGFSSQAAPLPLKPGLARWLVGLAAAGIAARLLIIAACANRISFADNLLNGGTGTLDDANQADRLVTISSAVSAVAFFAFLGVLIVVNKRGKNGDMLCAAISNNSAVKLTSRVYLISVVASVFLRSAFKQDDSASPDDQIHTIIHGDWASIALNVVVVAFLVVVITVTRRELANAKTAGAVPAV